jgi:hypothetical protein
MSATAARDVLDSCRRRFVLVNRAGENIELEPAFPEEFPLPQELVEDVRRHKTEILRLLDYETQVDALILESTRRIAAKWVPGCSLDSREWEQYQEAIHDAYWNGSIERLKAALRGREEFALSLFGAYSERN